METLSPPSWADRLGVGGKGFSPVICAGVLLTLLLTTAPHGVAADPSAPAGPPQRVVIEAENCRIQDASVVEDPDASGGKLVALERVSSRIESTVSLKPGTYRVVAWLKAESDSKCAIYIEIAGDRQRQWIGVHEFIYRTHSRWPVVDSKGDRPIPFAIVPAPDKVGASVDRIEFRPVTNETTLAALRAVRSATNSPTATASVTSNKVTSLTIGGENVGTAAHSLTNAVYYGRRLEPKGRAILHGAGQDYRTFLQYSQVMESNKPAVYMLYTAMGPDIKEFLEGYHRKLVRDGLSVVLQAGFNLPVDEILKGQLQDDMETCCQGLREYGRPVFLRPGVEFNLNHSKDPAGFAEAWRRFARVLRSQPGSDHVALVWCMTPDGDDRDLMAYYPGDEYVDWWGYDCFEPRHITHRRTIEFIEAAREHKFPVMIGESTPRWIGARQGEMSWNVWFKRYFEQLENLTVSWG